MKVRVGDAIPHFCLQDQDGNMFCSDQLKGKIAVIFFYPKDFTPGCTREACLFRDAYEDLAKRGVVVVGISADPPEQHKKFATRYNLPYILLSDPNNEVRKKFGVGKTFGLIPGRVTYIVDRDGIVRHIISSQFFPEKHVKEALEVVERLGR